MGSVSLVELGMNCKNCGASLRQGTTRCVKCGSHIEWPSQPQAAAPPPPQVVDVPQQQGHPAQPAMPQQPIAMGPPKSKVAAALLAFFLGCFGIHNFYLGFTGRGVAQLLITVLSLSCGYGVIITWIWAFIEFILILTGSITDKFGRPLA